jgi:DNA-binding MarR family transcriptional regulator
MEAYNGFVAMLSDQKIDSYGSRAWELFYEIFKMSKPHLEAVAATFDLTPQQAFALRLLSNDRPLPMSALATNLGCDASNVTSIVDKLESRGFVERRSADHDRRVKALVMTESGVALRERVVASMMQPPPAIANLSEMDQRALYELLARALEAI